MSTVFEEGRHAGEPILSEASRSRSRGVAIIPAGTGVVSPGTILGEITGSPGEFVPSPVGEVAGVEGAETASAMNIHGVDATEDAVQVTIIERDAELNGSCLEFDATITTEAEKLVKADQLKAAGIIVR